MTRESWTNIGIIGFLEKVIRSHPLTYIFFRSIIKFTNIFEKDFDGLTKLNFRKKINIIDVGASDGISIKFFLNKLKVGKIICYEPYYKYVKLLKKINNVIVRPYAVGNKSSNKKIYFPRYRFFGKNYDLITYTHYELKLLQHFIKDFKFKKNLHIVTSYLKIKKVGKINLKISLIKIDTNGFELSVIKGLLKVIKKDLPVIIIEDNKDKIKIEKILSKYNYTSFYYCVFAQRFTKKINKSSTNKYFLQKKHLNLNSIN